LVFAVCEASASAFEVVKAWSTMQARHENALRRLDQEHDSRMEEQVEDLRDKMRLLREYPARTSWWLLASLTVLDRSPS
jgi:hypothetical protein